MNDIDQGKLVTIWEVGRHRSTVENHEQNATCMAEWLEERVSTKRNTYE